MKFIRDLWHGDVPLVWTYWGFGVVVTLRTRKANICTRLQVPASGAFYFGWVVNTGKGAVARWIPRLHSNTVP